MDIKHSKHILFYAQSLGSGGAERQMVALASLLKKNGYIVSFFCALSKPDFYREQLYKLDIPVTYSKKKISKKYGRIQAILHQITCILEFASYVKKRGPYTVISFLPSSNFVACCARIFVKFRLITGERSSKIAFLKSAKGRFQTFFQRKADVIVCNSFYAQDLWIKYYPEFKKKITTIYNIIPDFNIPASKQVKGRDSLKIIILASYQGIKNPIRFINAVSLLTESERDRLMVDWWGANDFTGSLYNKCIQLIKDYHLEKSIILHGVTSNAFDEISRSDVVALVSEVEGLPNSICEGMMLGKPIIMSKVSDYGLLVDDSNGFLCDAQDEKSISYAIKCALNSSQEELEEMGRCSREKALLLFSQGEILTKWKKVID